MTPKPESSRGLALILVVLVLSALALIGTPFVISMKLQERGSVHTVAQERADLAALSARNHAVAHLFSTHPSREEGSAVIPLSQVRTDIEERGGTGGENGPEEIVSPKAAFDGLDELEIRFASRLALEPKDEPGEEPPSYPMRGWRDQILDVRVEDEQGKVNLNSALPNLLGNLFAGGHLSEDIGFEEKIVELPLDDTTSFPADEDPDTVDGVVIILNPLLFTMEAVSYRGKTDTHLTGCFRGEYLSGTWDQGKGSPVFDLRGLKIFLNRYYDLSAGELRTYRTPQSVREIADWSIIPYFLENMAVLGLNIRNMDEFGLTPEMLARAGLDKALLERKEDQFDDKEYRKARKELLETGLPRDALELLEKFRGKAAVIQAARFAREMEVGKKEMFAFSGVFESTIKKELKRLQKHARGYFPRAVEAYKQIYDQPGLETITARDFEKIRDLITTTSSRPAPWSKEQMVIGEISTNPIAGVPSLQLPSYDFVNPGTLVRIRSLKDAAKMEYHIALGAMPTPRGGRGGRGRGSIIAGGVILKEPLRFHYAEREAVVAAMLRHPVNINTAPRKVIEAVVTGLTTSRFGRNRKSVTSKEARALADFIAEARPVQGFEHFRELIHEAHAQDIIESADVEAILLNALNPNHPRLAISSTGFCFATGDVYTIDATGVVQSRAGVELAASRFREVIEVAPPDPLSVVLDTQDDWTFRIFRLAAPVRSRWGRSSTFLPGRMGNLMISEPVVLNQKQWEAPSMTEGSLRALTAELPQNREDYGFGTIGFGNVEHFPETIEGLDLAAGPYTMSSQQSATPGGAGGGSGGSGGGAGGAPATVEDLITRPGAVELWVRPRWPSRAGDRTFFDTLADPNRPFQNRMRLFFEGSSQSLVFQLMDDAGLQQGYPGNLPAASNVVAAAEIRHRVTAQTFANDTWYHVACVWGSTAPGDQALFIDHRPVGKNSWVSLLSSPLAVNSGRVSVEDLDFAARCPPRGTLLVGNEAIDYVAKQGSIFIVRTADPLGNPSSGRGARGTPRQQHPKGAPVRLFGYAIDIAPSDSRFAMNAPGTAILVGKGGAKLKEEQRQSYRWSNSMGLVPSSFPRVSAGAGNIIGAADTVLTVNSPNADPITLGFPRSGYLHARYVVNISGLFFAANWEYIKYSMIRPSQTPGVYEFRGLGRGMLGSTPLDPGLVQQGQVVSMIVRAVSIETDVADLDERYPQSGVIQIDRGIGAGASAATNAPDVEWIRYAMITEGKFFIGAPHQLVGHRGYTGNLHFDPDDPFRRNTVVRDDRSITTHPAGQEIYPVIRVARPHASFDDWVSIGESFGNPATRLFEPRLLRVRKAKSRDLGTFVSFWQQTENTYRVAGNPKLKKFPSGELPSAASGQIAFGAAAVQGQGGGPLSGTIDEIRMSRAGATDVDITPLPLPDGRHLAVDDVPSMPGAPSGILSKVIRTWFRKGDDVGSGQGLERIRLLGQSRLEPQVGSNGQVVGRTFTRGHPRSFGLGKPEALFFHNDEVFHYTFDPGVAEADVIVQLRQNLPRDALALNAANNLVDGIDRVIDPSRDLRSEMIPQIEVTTTAKLPPRDGFLEVVSDESKEVIYYQLASGNLLRNCLRGQLGTEVGGYIFTYQRRNVRGGIDTITRNINLRLLTTREVEMRGRSKLDSEPRGSALVAKSIVPLPYINVTRTTATIANDVLSVAATRGFSSQIGYLRIDDGNLATSDEVIAYQGKADDYFTLARDDRSGKGIFRGRYGTTTGGLLGADMTLVELPVRYHDRYQAQVETADLMYYERDIRIPGAHWDRIHWHEEEQRNLALKGEVRVLVRFDGGPDWDAEPTNEPGGLYLFSDPAWMNNLDVQADLLELRVYFRYLPGAYGRNAAVSGGGWSDEWKHSPVLESLTLEYRKPWRVIHREDLPF